METENGVLGKQGEDGGIKQPRWNNCTISREKKKMIESFSIKPYSTNHRMTHRVREVDSHNAHTSVNYIAKHRHVLTGGADGGHNLRQRQSLSEGLGITFESDDFRESGGHSTSGGKIKSGSAEHSERI